MIVFDLCCAAGDHRFEAWFASSSSFADQQARGLIICPICGDASVRKAVMAPRLGVKSNQRSESRPARPPSGAEDGAVAASGPGTGTTNPSGAMQGGRDEAAASAARAELVRHMMAEIAAKQAEMLPQSRWVGSDFADAARAMHEGRAIEEMIHGQTSAEEAQALAEDGIPAMPLLVPIVPPEALN